MTPEERYSEITIQAIRKTIQEDPEKAGPLIRRTILMFQSIIVDLQGLAEDMEEWAPVPILEFPDAYEIRREALNHVSLMALEALRENEEEEVGASRIVRNICDECGQEAAPSLDEIILATVEEHEPSAAIRLVQEVIEEEHYGIAMDALEKLPQHELRALRQAAVNHAAQEYEDEDEGEQSRDDE